jgi:hypothetical protein
LKENDMSDTSTTIDISTLSDDAAEKVARILLEDSEEESALIVLRYHGESVIVADDGNAEVEYPGLTAAEAAREYVADGSWGDSGGWVKVYTWTRWRLGDVTADEDDRESSLIAVSVEEPDCEEDEHDWCSPHEVVGGCEQNPGVHCHGGGVIIHEVCRHCGLLRTTDTWAQDPSTGTEGLESVEYAPLGEHEYSEAYERWSESE